ncbi:hypothetical protein [Haloarcula salina]|uniref:Uncharacterized protein n=1 Tax=Haloarcula salina TaxID=1429914 RepID=A0AA41FX40_9EURY|nr:hypothetical protein [Haloarcula salina]MBV0900171.1 hypothetical protein [Haloarcula salina]
MHDPTIDDDTADEAQLPDYILSAPYGDGRATIDLGDAETYQRARDAYEQALDAGAEVAFDTFLLNNVDLEWDIAVGGEAVPPFNGPE